MILFLEWLEAGRTVRGNIYGGKTGARKTFGRFPTDICYLEGELLFQIIWKIPDELMKRVS
jgi:hypothetical protein